MSKTETYNPSELAIRLHALFDAARKELADVKTFYQMRVPPISGVLEWSSASKGWDLRLTVEGEPTKSIMLTGLYEKAMVARQLRDFVDEALENQKVRRGEMMRSISEAEESWKRFGEYTPAESKLGTPPLHVAARDVVAAWHAGEMTHELVEALQAALEQAGGVA